MNSNDFEVLRKPLISGRQSPSKILVVLSMVYSIPAVYRKFERGQYLLSILVSQNIFAVNGYLIALFILGLEGTGISPQRLMTITWVTLGIGAVVFLLAAFRFRSKLKKGAYRAGTRTGQARENFEYRSYLPLAAVAGLGMVITIQSYVRATGLEGLNEMTAIILGLAIFYVMLVVLPEQLVILFCKYRYPEFNFYIK